MSVSLGTDDPRMVRHDGKVASFADFLSRESLPIIVCSAFTALAAVLLPKALSTDGWLALVDGRSIAHHGLPSHDHLTILTAGRDWVDQQWLGQLALYGLHVVGGVRLVLAANLVLVIGAFVAAVIHARRRGGVPTTVALVALVALVPFLVTAAFVRTQSFAYLPFVALVVVLSRQQRPSRRDVALILAALVVWSNVHGSVLLAAPLVALRGALDLRASIRLGMFDRRSLALLVGPWICVFASPYAFHLFSYYGRTAFNPTFSTYLSFWAPTTFSPISLPLLGLAFALIWLLGRTSEAYSMYERWLLVIAAIVGLMAVRNWPFTAVVAVMLAPVGFDRALRRREARPTPWFGAPLAVGVLAATVIGVIVALGRPNAALTRDFPRDAGAVTTAGASNARIYAGVKFADWLLWAHPALQGKVVFDARYELLTNDEVKRLVLFGLGTGVDLPLGRPTAYVLDPGTDERAIDALRPHVHVLYDNDRVFVANAAGRR